MADDEAEGMTENAVDAREVSLRQPTVFHLIALIPTWIAAAFLFALMAMTFADVLLRSAADNPIESATELTRLFMAIIVFASLPMVSWKGQHIAVDLLDPVFPAALARWRDTLIDIVCGVALLWPAKRIWDLAERARGYGDVTEYLNFPQYIPGWFIAFFTAVTALAFIARGLVRLLAPSRMPAR